MITNKLLTTSVAFFIFCLVYCPMSVASGIPHEALMILKSRKILGTVAFPSNHSQIDTTGRKSIRSSLPELDKNKSNKVVRAEGFSKKRANVAEAEAVKASMLRAKVVRDYLSMKGFNNVFITGFGTKTIGKTTISSEDRVEIAIYDKLMDIDGAEVLQTVESFTVESLAAE